MGGHGSSDAQSCQSVHACRMNLEVVQSHTGGDLRKSYCDSCVGTCVKFCPNFAHVFMHVNLSRKLPNCLLFHLCWRGVVLGWQDCFLSLTRVKGLRGLLRRREPARRQGVHGMGNAGQAKYAG